MTHVLDRPLFDFIGDVVLGTLALLFVWEAIRAVAFWLASQADINEDGGDG